MLLILSVQTDHPPTSVTWISSAISLLHSAVWPWLYVEVYMMTNFMIPFSFLTRWWFIRGYLFW
jgi:hypothetical protein